MKGGGRGGGGCPFLQREVGDDARDLGGCGLGVGFFAFDAIQDDIILLVVVVVVVIFVHVFDLCVAPVVNEVKRVGLHTLEWSCEWWMWKASERSA